MSRASDLKKQSERLASLPKASYSPKKSRSFNLSDEVFTKLCDLCDAKAISKTELISQLIDADFKKNEEAIKLSKKARSMVK